MSYKIEIRRRAEKDLVSLTKSDAQKIADAIYGLENELVLCPLNLFPYYCHSSLSGIFQKDCGQAAMTAIYALSRGFGRPAFM